MVFLIVQKQPWAICKQMNMAVFQKILFSKAGIKPDFVCGPWFANPYLRSLNYFKLLIKSTSVFFFLFFVLQIGRFQILKKDIFCFSDFVDCQRNQSEIGLLLPVLCLNNLI